MDIIRLCAVLNHEILKVFFSLPFNRKSTTSKMYLIEKCSVPSTEAKLGSAVQDYKDCHPVTLLRTTMGQFTCPFKTSPFLTCQQVLTLMMSTEPWTNKQHFIKYRALDKQISSFQCYYPHYTDWNGPSEGKWLTWSKPKVKVQKKIDHITLLDYLSHALLPYK